MKRITVSSIILALAVMFAAPNYAFDIKGALKQAAEKASQSDGKSGLGDLLGNVLSTNNIELSSLMGSWKYSAPAVKFKSDNVLKKAGGAAAATTIEGKLEPIFTKAGINGLTLTVNEDSTFTMKVKSVTLSGTITKPTDSNSKANFVFNFKAAKKINIGKFDTYVTKSANGTIDLTFDVSKLVTLLQKVSSLTSNSSISSVTKLLESYDGVCAGFRLTSVK